jgi:phosphoribosylanthranilate isomerase
VSVRVKICGITNIEDAVAAVDAGADALGFMFFEQSKRNLTFDRAAAIIHELPPFITKVGVFVNPTEDFVCRGLETTGIDTLQFHGEESPEFCARFAPTKVVKAFRIRDRSSLAECLRFREHAWLLDSYVAGAHGGTGTVFDWEVAIEATKRNRTVILAGGLKPDSVADAMRKVRPFAVDVSSGVESSPGKKDHAKVRAFISAAKEALP